MSICTHHHLQLPLAAMAALTVDAGAKVDMKIAVSNLRFQKERVIEGNNRADLNQTSSLYGTVHRVTANFHTSRELSFSPSPTPRSTPRATIIIPAAVSWGQTEASVCLLRAHAPLVMARDPPHHLGRYRERTAS